MLNRPKLEQAIRRMKKNARMPLVFAGMVTVNAVINAIGLMVGTNTTAALVSNLVSFSVFALGWANYITIASLARFACEVQTWIADDDQREHADRTEPLSGDSDSDKEID